MIYESMRFPNMDDIRRILCGDRFADYELIGAPVPVRDTESEIRCRTLCETNECGDYGRTWACPPGFAGNLDDYKGRFTKVAIMRRAFDVNVNDRERLTEISRKVQDDVRQAAVLIRGSGIDCKGFADGGCTYCGVCAYPEPCRFPEMLVPSVSSLGIDMGDFLKSIGEELEFREDRITLYGLLFLG